MKGKIASRFSYFCFCKPNNIKLKIQKNSRRMAEEQVILLLELLSHIIFLVLPFLILFIFPSFTFLSRSLFMPLIVPCTLPHLTCLYSNPLTPGGSPLIGIRQSKMCREIHEIFQQFQTHVINRFFPKNTLISFIPKGIGTVIKSNAQR